MSTEAAILIVIAAALLLGLFMLISTAPKRRVRKELQESRERAAGAHRDAAEARRRQAAVASREQERAETEAVEAEEKLRMARAKAQAAAERAEEEQIEASMHDDRAELHDQGAADGELGLTERDERPDHSLRSERDVVIGDDGTERSGRFARDTPTPALEAEKARSGRFRHGPQTP